jgi:hypothetical protein
VLSRQRWRLITLHHLEMSSFKGTVDRVANHKMTGFKSVGALASILVFTSLTSVSLGDLPKCSWLNKIRECP